MGGGSSGWEINTLFLPEYQLWHIIMSSHLLFQETHEVRELDSYAGFGCCYHAQTSVVWWLLLRRTRNPHYRSKGGAVALASRSCVMSGVASGARCSVFFCTCEVNGKHEKRKTTYCTFLARPRMIFAVPWEFEFASPEVV